MTTTREMCRVNWAMRAGDTFDGTHRRQTHIRRPRAGWVLELGLMLVLALLLPRSRRRR